MVEKDPGYRLVPPQMGKCFLLTQIVSLLCLCPRMTAHPTPEYQYWGYRYLLACRWIPKHRVHRYRDFALFLGQAIREGPSPRGEHGLVVRGHLCILEAQCLNTHGPAVVCLPTPTGHRRAQCWPLAGAGDTSPPPWIEASTPSATAACLPLCLCVSPSAASRQRSHLGLILPPEDAGPCLGMTVFVKTGAAPGVERVGARHAAPHPTTPGTDSNVSSAKGGTPAL